MQPPADRPAPIDKATNSQLKLSNTLVWRLQSKLALQWYISSHYNRTVVKIASMLEVEILFPDRDS
jgi:hypothetical protein